METDSSHLAFGCSKMWTLIWKSRRTLYLAGMALSILLALRSVYENMDLLLEKRVAIAGIIIAFIIHGIIVLSKKTACLYTDILLNFSFAVTCFWKHQIQHRLS